MKKKIIDVNELREQNIDDVYTFYYDETNNMRALKVTENVLNIRAQPICFTLGGVLHKRRIDHDIEFNKLHIDSSTPKIN